MEKVVLLLCATLCCVSGGAVAWPGAVPLSASVRTVIPPQVKGFGYSTSQYINAAPPSYSIGYQPQFGYQIPQLGVYPTYPGLAFQPVLAPSYYPGANPVYPGFSPVTPPIAIAPSPPSPGAPPSQEPAGDEDTAVVDSADFPSDQRGQDPSQVFQTPSNAGSFDSINMPAFPQAPQAPQIPPVPSIPLIQQYPGYPQLPQFPQQPLFQPNPSFPQAPSQPQPSGPQFAFPSPPPDAQSLGDEDTIAVDSA